MLLSLQLQCEVSEELAWLDTWLESVAQELTRILDVKSDLTKELVVVFVDEEKIRQLNSQYRNKDYVTDILSFAPVEESCLGELVVSPSKIRQQADENSHSFERELAYMLLHGILHLLGFDHEQASEAEKMFKLQDGVFDKLWED